MLTDRWSEIDRLFQAALEVPPEERESFLSSSPADTQVRDEVRSLIVRYDSDGGRLENTVLSASAMLRLLAHPELRPGQRLARYEVLSPLGSGGMGDVYLARDLTLARNVALKVLSKGLVDAIGGLEPVFAEARAASSLNHPNIITVFDAGEEEGRQFIAAEHVEGVTIRKRLAAGPVALHEGLAIAFQVARALSAAHAAGVVHRDVKPENIMLRPDGVVKVLDFGIAHVRSIDAPLEAAGKPGGAAASVRQPGAHSAVPAESSVFQTGPEPIVGSLAYMSPEQALGNPVDARSDIFSFGTLLFELFTGARPFGGSTNLSILMAVVSHPAVLPPAPHLPAKLRHVIARCLEKNPAARPQRMEEVAAVLERLRDRKNPSAIRKRRVLWAAACAAIALLAVGVFWWISHPATAHVDYIQRQVSDDRNYKDPVIVASGSAVFFHEVVNWKRSTVKVALNSGEVTPLNLPSAEPGSVIELEDFSAESGNLLYRTWKGEFASGVFHLFNEAAGTDTTVPSIRGYAGNLSPDGNRFALFSGPPRGVFIADLTGSAKPVCPGPAPSPWLRTIAWSPDGRTLRFMKSDRLFEVSVDGSNPRPVFDSAAAPQGAGRWTPDGSRFIFSDDWTGDLWSVSEGRGLLAKREFTQITSGPMQFGTPALSPNGRTIYAVGQIKKGRLNRYDAHSRVWEPEMGGFYADGVDYSRDGKTAVYVGFPRREVGISRADGSGRRDLTSPPMRAYLPRLSPDGKQVAFMGRMPGQPWRIYLVPVDGGESRLLPVTPGGEEPNWSPDGSKIVYATVPWEAAGGPSRMYAYDLASGSVTPLPNSGRLFSPRWSPDGRFLAANRFESYGMNPFALLDPVTGKRTDFPEGVRGVFPAWSHDSHFLYFLNKAILGPATVFKLSIEDGSVQPVARFQNRVIANLLLPSIDSLWMGLTPDESPLVLEDIGSREIYEIFPANSQRLRR